MSRRVISSSAPNGSSSNITFGSEVSVRASDARIFMPPDSIRGNCASNPRRPTASMACWARARRSDRGRRAISAQSSTFARTDRHDNNVGSWKMKPTESVASATLPSVGRSRPAAIRSSVDLPHPDGPTTATKSPSAMSRSTPSRAQVPEPNCLVTPDAEMTTPLVRCRASASFMVSKRVMSTSLDRKYM